MREKTYAALVQLHTNTLFLTSGMKLKRYCSTGSTAHSMDEFESLWKNDSRKHQTKKKSKPTKPEAKYKLNFHLCTKSN